jgi:hypothetical protein
MTLCLFDEAIDHAKPETDSLTAFPPPRLGDHTADVPGDLGCSAAKIAEIAR